MGLYERLSHVESPEEPKISVHHFVAAAAEVARGVITANTAANFLGLSPSERTEAQTLIARCEPSGPLTRVMVHDALLLMEMGYRTIAQTKTRLGV